MRFYNLRHARLLALYLGGFNLAFWPTDLYVFRGQPESLRVFAVGRSAILAVLLAIYVLVGLRALRPILEVAAAALGTALCFIVAYVFGELGGPGEPWFHFCYLFPLAPLVLWGRPWARVAMTFGIGVAVITGYFFCHPRYLSDRFMATSCAYLLFAAAIGVLLGFHADRLRSRAFFLRRKLSQQASRLESRVAEQTAELRLFAAELAALLERDRTRLARELHDELGQELTAVRYALKVASVLYAENPASIGGQLQHMSGLLQSMTATVRGILLGLRPQVLDDLGLAAAVEWLARRFQERSQLVCQVDVTGAEEDLPQELATAAFRIVQEALTNVVRHADATQASVRVWLEAGALAIVVSDDGVGYTPDVPAQGRMGIVGMRERAQALGGELRVERGEPRGTVVRVRLPYRPQEAQQVNS